MAGSSFDVAGVTVEQLTRKVNQFLDAKKSPYFTRVLLDSKDVRDAANTIKSGSLWFTSLGAYVVV
jgi:hypothetical protein